MHITYLGHAGFCVETSDAILIMDPWLSPGGAFDSAWFQFPRNHQLAPMVLEKLRYSPKQKFLYISHEHHDHFDPEFIATLPHQEITYILPHFERAALRTAIAEHAPKKMVTCPHGGEVSIPGGYVKLYLDDSGLNRDSAILVNIDGQTFLNLNDCKLYDELPAIVQDQGPITVFASQFSGATWHPTCYEYPPQEYERISHHKMMSKFEMVARAIQTAGARFFLPSAGPACFLDPALIHLNFEPVNIFPRSAKFLDFLTRRLADSPTQALYIAPGDVLDVLAGEITTRGTESVAESNFEPYITAYAEQYREFFFGQHVKHTPDEIVQILERLRHAVQTKLDVFTLHERVRVPLYFGFSDSPSSMLRVDFPRRLAEAVSEIREPDYYSIVVPSWQIARVLDGAITWEQFALTFRMRLNRKPDVYQTLIQGFILMEPDDMNWFCAQLLEIEEKQKRVIIEAGGTRYSIDRFCPHQGADLTQGWLDQGRLWTCPRHRWQFALDKGGQCLTSNGSIHAVCLENE